MLSPQCTFFQRISEPEHHCKHFDRKLSEQYKILRGLHDLPHWTRVDISVSPAQNCFGCSDGRQFIKHLLSGRSQVTRVSTLGPPLGSFGLLLEHFKTGTRFCDFYDVSLNALILICKNCVFFAVEMF